MLDVAIIDDDIESIKAIKDILSGIEIVGFVESYQSFETFFEAADGDNHYDVILLDIQFDKQKENGIDYAKKLFTVYPHLKIVFISGFAREYISEVFIPRINLAGFIEKPIDRSILERMLEKIQNDNETRKSEIIKVNSNGRTVVIPLRDINYIESDGHYINIYVSGSELRQFNSLNEIAKKLPAYFKRCHRSFIVNMNYIKEIGNNSIIMDDINNTQIPVSRVLYNGLRKEFFEYIGDI